MNKIKVQIPIAGVEMLKEKLGFRMNNNSNRSRLNSSSQVDLI
jgi:hypothetical protein